MEFVKQQVEDGVAVLRMARGKVNPLNGALVGELVEAFDEAREDDAVHALVLASELPGFFSAGLDASEVFGYERDEMRSFFGRFMDLFRAISCHPKPVVAAVNGHAYAGGAALALACDIRILAEGTYGFALNEVRIGLVVPIVLMRLALAAVGVHHGRDMALTGRQYSPEQALDIGLADDVVPPDALMPTAIARAQQMGQLPAAAFAITKEMLAKETLFPDGSDRTPLDPFLDYWFSEEAAQHKQALIESLRK